MAADKEGNQPNILQSKINAFTEKSRLFAADALTLAKNLHDNAPLLVIATHQSPYLVKFVASIKVPHKDTSEEELRADPFSSFAAVYSPYIGTTNYDLTYHGIFDTDYLHIHERAPGIPLSNENVILPPPNTVEFANLAFQLCDAVDSLHNIYYFGTEGNIIRSAVVHRDIRPDNVLYNIAQNGMPEVRLMDYDISKLEGTDDKVQVGNSAYSPIEQYRGETYRQSDIFSLALMIFDMMIGDIAERFKVNNGIYTRNSAYPKRSEEYEPFLKKYPHIGEVIDKALDAFYYNRQQSVKEFWFDFSIAWQKEFNQELPQMEFSSNKALRKLTEVKQIMSGDVNSKRARLTKVLTQRAI